MPNTLEGWAVLIAALILLALGIILIVICVLRPQKEFRLSHVNGSKILNLIEPPSFFVKIKCK
jgi:hypothetical protein